MAIMNTKRLRGALIGCGYFAQYQMEAWQLMNDLVEMVAVCDISEEKARAFADRYRVPLAFTSARALFEELQLDFVDIATRPDTHLELTCLAAEHGVHVLCQKPMARNTDEAKVMIDCCKRHGVRLMINENWRWQPWYREMRRLLDAGQVGRPFYLYLAHRNTDSLANPPFPHQPYFVEMPRLLIYETLVHHIDTAVFLFGQPVELYAYTQRINPQLAGEDLALIHIVFEGDRSALIDANRCSPAETAGPVDGTARLDGTEGSIYLRGDGRILIHRRSGAIHEHHYPIPNQGYRGDSCYATQRHFVEALIQNSPFETDGETYLKIFEAVFLAYESAEKRRIVRLK